MTPLQKAAWNKAIRDSVDALLHKGGYNEESSARHQLAMMNFDVESEQAQSVEPVAWAMRRADGLVLDVICPDEHESHEGDYTMPLYLHPAGDHVPDATKMMGERAELIAGLREHATFMCIEGAEKQRTLKAADMLEADAQYDQQAMELCPECGWKAIMPGEQCFVCNMQTEAQQAVPMTDAQIETACRFIEPTFAGPIAYDLLIARAIEAHHGITGSAA